MGRFDSRLNTGEDKIINLQGESEEYIQIESWMSWTFSGIPARISNSLATN